MSGTIFSYLVGYLRVGFSVLNYGEFAIDLHIHGDGVVKTAVDDALVENDRDIEIANDLTVRLMACPASCSFFTPMVTWLEAIICGVQECAFGWDAEGPEGRLRWFNHYDGTGRLKVTWEYGRAEPQDLDRVFHLEQKQVVSAFYQALRTLVTSPGYDRIDCEPVTLGECVGLVLDADDQAALPQVLASRNRRDAARLLHVFLGHALDSHLGYPRRARLQQLLDAATTTGVDDWVEERWFAVEWDAWAVAERERHVVAQMYGWQASLSSGERLSALRSAQVEEWLARPPAS